MSTINLSSSHLSENHSNPTEKSVLDMTLSELIHNYAKVMAGVVDNIVNILNSEDKKGPDVWWINWWNKIIEILIIFMNKKNIIYVGFTFILISVFLYYAMLIE